MGFDDPNEITINVNREDLLSNFGTSELLQYLFKRSNRENLLQDFIEQLRSSTIESERKMLARLLEAVINNSDNR